MKVLIPLLIPILLSCTRAPLETPSPYILGEVWGKENVTQATHFEILNSVGKYRRGEFVYTYDLSCFYLAEIGDTISGVNVNKSRPISWDCNGDI